MIRKMMNRTEMIQKYQMLPHAEGGYFAEIWQEPGNAASLIFYLLPQGETAAWHRLSSEELWLFHQGGEVRLETGGNGKRPVADGACTLNATHLEARIPANTWQRASASQGDVLVSCLTCPGFAVSHWELYKEKSL